jgi:hypothetical protein
LSDFLPEINSLPLALANGIAMQIIGFSQNLVGDVSLKPEIPTDFDPLTELNGNESIFYWKRIVWNRNVLILLLLHYHKNILIILLHEVLFAGEFFELFFVGG